MNKQILLMVTIIALIIVGVTAVYLGQPKAGFPGSSIYASYTPLADAANNGKPTIIYFSTESCPTCMLQDNAIDEVMLGFNATHNFVILKLNNEVTEVFKEWSIMEVPTLVFADRTGTIVERFDGQYLPSSSLRAELERIG